MTDMTPRRLLGLRIAAARDRSGMTQPELARACGWTKDDGSPAQTRVSNYERGVREPGIAEVMQIADATGQSLLYFYDIEGELTAPERRREEFEALSELPPGKLLDFLEHLSQILSAEDIARAAALFSAANLKKFEAQ